VKQDPKDRQVLQEHQEHQDRGVKLDQQVQQDLVVQLVQQGNLAPQDLKEIPV
jgi:aminoglycoside phosphotransferase family enzyme